MRTLYFGSTEEATLNLGRDYFLACPSDFCLSTDPDDRYASQDKVNLNHALQSAFKYFVSAL